MQSKDDGYLAWNAINLNSQCNCRWIRMERIRN